MFENQNVQKNGKITIYLYEKSQKDCEKALANNYFRIREKKDWWKDLMYKWFSKIKNHDYQSTNLVLIWKPLDILNERTINRMIDSAIYSWWSGQWLYFLLSVTQSIYTLISTESRHHNLLGNNDVLLTSHEVIMLWHSMYHIQNVA